MSAPSSWHPLPQGGSGTDWSRPLAATARFDPYAAWFDARSRVLPCPLVLELAQPFSKEALKAINQLGLWVPRHYIGLTLPGGDRPKYITAWCLHDRGLGKLIDHVLREGGVVKRYELSGGFANPDYYPQWLDESLQQVWSDQQEPKAADAGARNVVGVIDYGCAFLNRKFADGDGKQRIALLWNQEGRSGPAPTGKARLHWRKEPRFEYGHFATDNDFATFSKQYVAGGRLDEQSCYRDAEYEAIRRDATHGTFVMDVATGTLDPQARHGAQPKVHGDPIVFVQLPRHLPAFPQQVAGLLRAHVLDGVHFIARTLETYRKGVINLSYGGYCGPHDGTSVLEGALDELLAAYDDRLALVVAAGNALDAAVHAQLHVPSGGSEALHWANVPDDPSDSFVELWWPGGSQPRLRVIAPDGAASVWVGPGVTQVLDRRGQVAAVVSCSGAPCQSDHGAMALLAVAPTAQGAAPYGLWRIEVESTAGGAVLVDAWCERDDPVFGNEAGPRQSRFVDCIEKTGTLNALAHGKNTCVVGGFVLHETNPGGPTDGPVWSDSATGPGRGLSGRDRCRAAAGLPGPQVLSPADSGLNEGLVGTAVLTGQELRLSGTSVAAAAFTRRWIDAGFRNPNMRPQVRSPMTPGRDRHPDDDLATPMPRVP